MKILWTKRLYWLPTFTSFHFDLRSSPLMKVLSLLHKRWGNWGPEELKAVGSRDRLLFSARTLPRFTPASILHTLWFREGCIDTSGCNGSLLWGWYSSTTLQEQAEVIMSIFNLKMGNFIVFCTCIFLKLFLKLLLFSLPLPFSLPLSSLKYSPYIGAPRTLIHHHHAQGAHMNSRLLRSLELWPDGASGTTPPTSSYSPRTSTPLPSSSCFICWWLESKGSNGQHQGLQTFDLSGGFANIARVMVESENWTKAYQRWAGAVWLNLAAQSLKSMDDTMVWGQQCNHI